MNPPTSPYSSFSCPGAMGCSQLCFKNFTSTRSREHLILYSLYPISGPCPFSKFIACCIRCRRNGTGSFSLISPDVSFLKSKVSLYPAALRGLVPSSVYEILWGIWIPAHAIAMSVFMLDVIILFLPHCSFSLWKHVISICLVHNCTWCCTTLHTLQYSVFTSFLPSFPIFPAPSVPSLLPFILRMTFPSCRKYAFHTPRTSCRLGRLPPSTTSGIDIPLPTSTQVRHSVPKPRFPSWKSPAHLVVG